MGFFLPNSLLKFFYTNGFLELEDLISEKKRSELIDVIPTVINDSLDKKPATAQNLFSSGYYCWNKHPSLHSFFLNRNYAHIAAQLSNLQSISLGASQILYSSTFKEPLFKTPVSLSTLCSVQHIICGFIASIQQSQLLQPPLPTSPGNLTFLHPETLISFDYLNSPEPTIHLMLIYTSVPAIYAYNTTDPHTHFFKQHGYSFGDHFQPHTHPSLVY